MNPFDQFDPPHVATAPITGPRAPAPQTPVQAERDRVALEAERLRLSQAKEQASGTIDIPGDRTKTGEEYLHTLSPADAAIVRAMAEGRSAIPAGYSMRSQRAQQLLAATAQYDPTFDAANLPSRIATRKAFTSGKQGQNIISFNTALGHLQRLAQSSEKLDNTSFPIINRARNFVFQASGYPEVDTFNTDRQAVVDELTRAFRGSGGNVSDIVEWERKISSAKSPAQLRGVIGEAAALLQSRIDALQASYNEGMKTTDKPLPMLYDHARDALQALQSPDYRDKGYTAIGGQFPHDGGPSGGAGNGHIDPEGIGDIGFHGGPPHQNEIVGIPDEKLKEFQAFMRQQRQGAVPDDQLGEIIGRKYQEITGRPLNNAASLAATFNKTGQIPASITYQPTGDLKAQIDEETRQQDLIQHQDISQERGGGGAPETVDALVRSAANGLTWGGANKLVAGAQSLFGPKTYEEYLAHQRAIDQFDTQNHFAPQLVGAALGVMGNETAVAGLTRVPALGRLVSKIPKGARPALADALYGAAYGATDADNGKVGSALSGALLAGGGGMLGRGATRLVGATLAPVAAPVVQRLTDKGITLTPGQILGASQSALGRSVKWLEDKSTSRFGLGDFISGARMNGVKDFNRAAANDALEVIGRELPPDVGPGHPMIQHLQTARDEAYDAALEPLKAHLDDKLISDLQDIGEGVRPDQRDAFMKAVTDKVKPHLPTDDAAPLTGRQIQSIKRGLNEKIFPLKRDVNGADLADDLSNVRDAFLSFAQRSDPENSAAYAKADAFHSRLSRIEDAAARTKDGIFTPQQFRTAIGRRGYGTTTANLAAGEAPFQQLATDASTVLPSSIPDSGTAGRVASMVALPALGGLAGGGLGYGDDSRNEALTGAALGAMLFTKPGLRSLQWTLAGSRGKALNSLGSFLREGATIGPTPVGQRLIPPIDVIPPEIAGYLAAPAALGVSQSGGN